MILVSAAVSAIADMVWGGQARRYSEIVHDYRRVISPVLVALSLVFFIGVPQALVAMVGYLAVRVAGWRFKPAGGELFLGMEKVQHLAFAFIHGLLFSVIPVAAHLLFGAELVSGLVYWLAFAAFAVLPWALIMAASRKFGRDLVPVKEAVWGGTFGAAAYFYFAYVQLDIWFLAIW